MPPFSSTHFLIQHFESHSTTKIAKFLDPCSNFHWTAGANIDRLREEEEETCRISKINQIDAWIDVPLSLQPQDLAAAAEFGRLGIERRRWKWRWSGAVEGIQRRWVWWVEGKKEEDAIVNWFLIVCGIALLFFYRIRDWCCCGIHGFAVFSVALIQLLQKRAITTNFVCGFCLFGILIALGLRRSEVQKWVGKLGIHGPKMKSWRRKIKRKKIFWESPFFLKWDYSER